MHVELEDAVRFGVRIRMARVKRGISQAELAGRAGISRTYLSMLERGEANNPSHAIVRNLKAVLDTGTLDEPDARHTASCLLCGTRYSLEMVPYHKNGQLVGWIFACAECAPQLYNSDVDVTLPSNAISKRRIIAGGQDANRLR